MRKEIYWNLLTLCATLSQGLGALPEPNSEESLDLHVRKKRLIDKTPHGNKPVSIEEVSYIVSVLIHDFPTCAGSIITPIVVLTAAHCVYDNWRYSIISGTHYSKRGTHHTVTGKLIHPGYNPHVSDVNGIALLHVSPPIDLTHSYNRAIEIGTGPVTPLTLGIVSGWGSNFHEGLIQKYPTDLRSFSVPVINNAECQWRYGINKRHITERHICTFDKEFHKYCSIGDAGDPLVVNNKLVGVLVWTGFNPTNEKPDVFVRVSHPALRAWIYMNTKIIEGT